LHYPTRFDPIRHREVVMSTRASWAGLALAFLLMPVAAQAQPAAHEWYVGGHAGLMSVRIDYSEPERPQFDVNPNADGFVGGLLAGYDRVSGRLLIGVDLDLSSGSVDLDPGDAGGNRYTSIDLGWQTRLRGRAGAAWKRTRLFAAAGLVTVRALVDDVDPGFGESRARHFGWTAGGGLEYQLGGRLRARAEYLFDDYRPERHTITAPAGEFFPVYTAETSFTASTFRGALLFRF
jgi:opacity protein-like surface antigen